MYEYYKLIKLPTTWTNIASNGMRYFFQFKCLYLALILTLSLKVVFKYTRISPNDTLTLDETLIVAISDFTRRLPSRLV
jgi:hypothetical protein